MKPLQYLILLVFSCVSAQQVTVVETFDTSKKPQYQQFVFLTDSTDLSTSIKVATIKASGSLKKPLDLVAAIGQEAHKIGGNSYRFVNFTKGAKQTANLRSRPITLKAAR